MNNTSPKKCAKCNKPATLHVSKVVDGKVYKVGYCGECPEAKAILTGSVAFDLLENGPQPVFVPASTESQEKCPNCGLTPADFKELGRLGCSRCYETFESKLQPLLGKLHNGSEHLGKTPRGQRRELSPERIQALRDRLQEYVNREEYELAAVVRDQLKELGSCE